VAVQYWDRAAQGLYYHHHPFSYSITLLLVVDLERKRHQARTVLEAGEVL
jgi:hypothetical protein